MRGVGESHKRSLGSAAMRLAQVRLMARLGPAAEGDQRPDGLDDAERPSALEKAVDRAQKAEDGKAKDEPGAPAFGRVGHQHAGDGEEAEQGQGVQGHLLRPKKRGSIRGWSPMKVVANGRGRRKRRLPLDLAEGGGFGSIRCRENAEPREEDSVGVSATT